MVISGKLRFKTEQDQNIWGECSRLIANCIIYYIASILSNMLVYKETNGQNVTMKLKRDNVSNRK